MSDHALPIPPVITSLIAEELRINQEIAQFKVSLEESKRRLSNYRNSRSLRDKIGITRIPFRRTADKELAARIEHLEQSLEQSLQLWQQKKRVIDREMDVFFQRYNIEYQQVALASHIFDEIKEITVRLKEHIHHYRLLLIDVQAYLPTKPLQNQYPPHVSEMIEHAIKWGYQSDALIDQMHEADRKYHTTIHGTFLKKNEFPTILPLNLGDFSSGIKLLPIRDASIRIRHMIAILQHFEEHSLSQYSLELEQSQKRHKLAQEQFIQRAWEISRQTIWKHIYHQEQSEEAVPHIPTAIEA